MPGLKLLGSPRKQGSPSAVSTKTGKRSTPAHFFQKWKNYIDLHTVVDDVSILDKRIKRPKDREMLKLRPYSNSDLNRWKYALIASNLKSVTEP